MFIPTCWFPLGPHRPLAFCGNCGVCSALYIHYLKSLMSKDYFVMYEVKVIIKVYHKSVESNFTHHRDSIISVQNLIYHRTSFENTGMHSLLWNSLVWYLNHNLRILQGILGFPTGCRWGVWGHWLTTCLLYVGHFFGKSFLNKLACTLHRMENIFYRVKYIVIIPVHIFCYQNISVFSLRK